MSKQLPVTVYQNNDPEVEFSLVIAGTETPYDLTAATVEFFIKESPVDADPSPATYRTANSSIVVTDAPGGVLVVKFAAADLAAAGDRFYHLDAIVGGKRQTLASGPLYVLDI